MPASPDQEMTALLATRFQGTILGRRSLLPSWLHMSLVVLVIVAGLGVFTVGAAASQAGSLDTLMLGGLILIAAGAAIGIAPLHFAAVPSAIPVEGGRWVATADLIPAGRHPSYFRTSTGTLLKIERGSIHHRAVYADLLPEGRARSRQQRERQENARQLIARGKFDAARALVDGAVDGWRLR